MLYQNQIWPFLELSSLLREIRPYQKLAAPADLPGRLDPNGLKTYTKLWGDLTLTGGAPRVCKFCHNLLEVIPGKSEAEAFVSDARRSKR